MKLEVTKADGSKTVVEDKNWNASKHLEKMQDQDTTHVAIGNALYHKSTITSVEPVLD